MQTTPQRYAAHVTLTDGIPRRVSVLATTPADARRAACALFPRHRVAISVRAAL